MRKHVMRAVPLLLLAGLFMLAIAATPRTAKAVEREPLKRALLATVRVAVPIEQEKDTYSTGSGTVLSDDGLILTNYHVMGDMDAGQLYNRKGRAFIAVNPVALKGAPTWLYLAEMVRGDPKLDLALLKIVGYMDSKQDLPSQLPLTTIQLGDSDSTDIGDELSVIGFPGLGGDTVTFTQGKVSGFLDEDGDRVFDWIKTDAEVNHGNSGGLAIDSSGRMIGVPTAGMSDMEAAGKISLVRPINLAIPLIKASATQSQAPAASGACRIETHPGGATISNLVFAKAVDRQGNPDGVSASFASGLDTVYAVFDYDRLRNGKEFRFTWFVDDEQVFEDSVAWASGSRGSEWVNLYSDTSLPDGVYRLELRYDGKLLACGAFTLGVEPAEASPQFGPITFAAGERNDAPVDAGTQFASGATEIYAFFDYEGMSDGLDFRQVWYVDGEVGLDVTDPWSAGEQGNYWVSVNSQSGLPDGSYVLELYVGDELVQEGEFTIGDGAGVPEEEGVMVIGRVVDANRRSLPIAEATVIFLNPGVSINQWARTQRDADVLAVGVTDTDGYFQLSGPVQPGETYPVIVLASGYRPIAEQNFTVPADAESPYELDITMVRE